jgi:hypothetical protein
MKEGCVECQECGVIHEVILQDTVQNDDMIDGVCPECGNIYCLIAILEDS